MLKFPCLVLDHDDTVVQSETTINFPYFQYVMAVNRPGVPVTLADYTEGCNAFGFAEMCRRKYGFTDQEIDEEYEGWKFYIREHIPDPFPGIEKVIRRQKELGGIVCVVSHSSEENIRRDYQTHFGLQPDAIFGWDYPEEQRKPHPWPLLQIMKIFSFNARDMLVVDDMRPAWEMARKAGTAVAFAEWGRKNSPHICAEMRTLCDYSFDSPEKLEAFLFDT